MIKFLESAVLRIGCHWSGFSFISILLGVAFVLTIDDTEVYYVLLLPLLLTFISFLYYGSHAKKRFSAFEKALIKNDQKTLKLEDAKAIALFKKGRSCKRVPKSFTQLSYTATLIYVGDKFLTISSKCPKFFMFKKDRYGRDKKWAVKTKCEMSMEFYYSYIQSVFYDVGDKKLKIVLISGETNEIPCEKNYGNKAESAIRENLRVAERYIPTRSVEF